MGAAVLVGVVEAVEDGTDDPGVHWPIPLGEDASLPLAELKGENDFGLGGVGLFVL